MLPGFESLAPRRRRPAPGRSAPAVSGTAAGPPAAVEPDDGLNAEQRAAAQAPLDRHCLVVAGAGSGKTKTLIARYRRLMAARVPAASVMTVAFNKTAANEIAERLQAASGRKPRLNGTFHSLGYRLLSQIKDDWDLPRDVQVLSDKEIKQIVRAAVRRLELGKQVTETALAISAIDGWKNRGMTVEQARSEVDAMPQGRPDSPERERRDLFDAYARLYAAYEEEKRRLARIDFADMLLMPVVSMRASDVVRRAFAGGLRHILVDEYQDVNDCQYEFLHQLASEGARLFCVGDDFQAIYGWRQARVEHILNFRADHPDAVLVKLTKNYRCSPEILAAANRISAGLRHKLEEKQLEATRPAARPPVCGEFDDRKSEARAIGDKVQSGQSRGLGWRDFAVLSRTNKNLRAVEDEMMRRRVPYVVAGGSFWERPEILDVLAYLEAIVDPRADEAFLRVVNVPARSVGLRSVEALRLRARQRGAPAQSRTAMEALSGMARRGVEELLIRMEAWRGRLQAGEPVSSVLADVMTETGYSKHWRKDPESLLERMENVQELIAAADDYGDPKDLLEHARHCRAQAARVDKDAVTLSTIHRAKGLEWDTVFLIACEHGAMPHYLSTSAAEIDEERRLCYVAFTRAANRLFVSCAVGAKGAVGPSDYLIETADLFELREGFDKPARAEAAGTWRAGAAGRGDAARAKPKWAEVLGVSPDDALDRFEVAYRQRVKTAHPDAGGSHEAMTELNLAIEMARAHHEKRRARAAA